MREISHFLINERSAMKYVDIAKLGDWVSYKLKEKGITDAQLSLSIDEWEDRPNNVMISTEGKTSFYYNKELKETMTINPIAGNSDDISVYDLLVEFLNIWTGYLVEKTRYPDMEYCTNVIMLVDSKWQCTTHIVRKIKTTVQSKL